MGYIGSAITSRLLPLRRRRLGSLAASAAAALRPWERLGAERERWALWTPVGFGLGIAVYFGLGEEPPLWLGPVLAAAAALLGLVLAGPPGRRRPVVVLVSLALTVVMAGFTAAQLRTAAVTAPRLEDRVGPVWVTGEVERFEDLADGQRVTLAALRIGGLAPERTPARVRIRLRGAQPPVAAGATLRLRAVLMPPPPPAAPEAFDFQRQSFFEGRGAVGFALGRATVLEPGEAEGRSPWRAAIERLRQHVGERVRAQVAGAVGAVMATLMTGERGAIPEPALAAMRDSGLAHLLAISGLHIGLVAGIVFAAVRGGLALVPAIALRHPIKKWAAVAAILAAGGYTLLAGATVPTQRAFLMLALVMAAVLLDRRGLSMRAVAWAAVVILAVSPESLLGASFQMSFAAVVALIAFYEALRDARRRRGEPPDWPRRIGRYMAGVAMTTLIAGTATSPFAVYHFNRFAAYGLAANLLAVPVTALWVMPWAVMAFALMPFGLDRLALAPMALGVEVVLDVAAGVAAWPGAVAELPAMSMPALAAVTLGGLWHCLWRTRWRYWGVPAVAAGLATMVSATPPDILVDGGGDLIAVREASGELSFSSLRAARFARQAWLQRSGDGGTGSRWPRYGTSADGRLSCDSLGCIYRAGGHVVAIARRPEALEEDCRTADVVVATVPVRTACPSARRVIDRFDLWREGTHAVWLNEGRVRVESVNGRRGDRPWVDRRRPRPRLPASD